MTALQMPLFIFLGILAFIALIGGVFTDWKFLAMAGGLLITATAVIWITGDW